MKNKVEVKVKRIDVFQKVKENKTMLSKLDYAITYASDFFLYDDVIEITIQ